MFLLWNLIFMSLMQPYIWLNYAAYYSLNSRIMSRMYFWYGFIFIWDGVGMWWSAFGTLYATLLPRLFTLASSHLLANILLHPLTLNAFCFAPPTILMITQLVTSTFSAIAWSNLVHTRSYLLDSLATLATQWNARDHQKLDETLVQRAVAVGTLFLKRKELSLVAFQRNMGACAIWYLLCTILFTPTALWLLSIIRGSLNQEMRRMNTCVCRTAVTWGSSSPPFHLHWNPVRQSNPPAVSNNLRHQGEPDQIQWSSDAGANYRDSQNESMRSLRRAFFTVGLQFFATFFCMSAAAGGWLWMTIDAGRMIVRPELHSFAIILSMWVFATAGCLINLFILEGHVKIHRNVLRACYGRLLLDLPPPPGLGAM
ncbi:hypothetical protein FRC08_009416 [Ceratobasidium sp. 394]|nr:hypothetical protein FRC08_009416 [Ceratobasidium sp. 394]